MSSPKGSNTSKDTDYPVFQNVDPRWCGREESILLDAIEAFGYGNWEVIADLFKFECADKNFTVQDIIDHCNLIFGRNALGAVWDSRIICERRSVLCDHTGPDDDVLINSSDVNAAKNLTPEQLDSVGYMPLREEFLEVEDQDIASLIPEIRFKERYLQEHFIRRNSTDDKEIDVEFMLEQYDTDDEEGKDADNEEDVVVDDDDVEEEDENKVCDEEEDKVCDEVEDEKIKDSENLNAEEREPKIAKETELEMEIEANENRIQTRSSTLRGIRNGEFKPLQMLCEPRKQRERTKNKNAPYQLKKELKNAKNHSDYKEVKRERKVIREKREKKVKERVVVERACNRRKGKATESMSSFIDQMEKMDEIEEQVVAKTGREVVVESSSISEDEKKLNTQPGRHGNWMEKYLAEEEMDEYDGTTEDEADDDRDVEESFRDQMDVGLLTENDENEVNEMEELWGVDGNMVITDILVEAVDMYCKDMRERALANRLISCHRLVEHYFKYEKQQIYTESEEKAKKTKPADLSDESCMLGVLKTFARFLEPGSLENFLEDFAEENRLRAKMDNLSKEFENSDYAVFHLASVNSEKGDAMFG